MLPSQWATYSGQQVADAYAREADAFGAIGSSPIFPSILDGFSSYEVYAEKIAKTANQQEQIRTIIENGGVLDTASPDKTLAQIFCVAQVAACCELFRSWKIPTAQLNREGMRQLVRQGSTAIQSVPAIPVETAPEQYSAAQRQLLSAINEIQNVDTVRCVQVTRLLGLITTPSTQIQQLSLGANNGYRDLYGIHLVPSISIQTDNPIATLSFKTGEQQAASTVLVDNDPVFAEHYAALNEKHRGRVLALNVDADRALQMLQIKQQGNALKRRNLVVGLRIDHRMIPDAEVFLRTIASVVDDSADLLLTVGAGNNQAEFEGRLQCFDALFGALGNMGLRPVRILMHAKGTPQEQRSRPHFGQLAYSSYQLLHCKLHPGQMQYPNPDMLR
jgi:hypothetical protein